MEAIRRSYKSIFAYGLELLGWGVLVVHLFRTIAFKSVPGMNLVQSNWLFWGIWSACILVGLLLTPSRRRTDITLFATINSPIAIYLLLAYNNIYQTAFVIALIIIGLALLLYLFLVVVTNIKDVWLGKYRGKLIRFFVMWCIKAE